ncbi:hypothetical protein BWQ96_04362 [Gracilariopsis chorda]|uniref:Aminoglycoside phosphotransferase domain-containing protein n=1 Tax=Gracilariopsis chorda TaxID=448386 RepID=A0A2V3IUP2_9FLOR|nr:hypothetical protein BWQ96_04362 [Gracilariopsis chorda]|eukprot:PXF45825.1 hypothetical protein BWQ96_04362 [Gracilariopsis chorda]
MTIAVETNHVCPPDRTPLPYVVVISNADRSSFIVKHNSDGKLCFPRLECPEIPVYAKRVCECLSQRFEKMCGTRYELILLYSTINDFRNDHIRPIFSNFYCLSPNDKSTGMPVAPANKQYEWMGVNEVSELVDSMGEEKSCWINDTKDFETFAFMMRDEVYKKGEEEFGLQPWEIPGWFTSTANAATDTLAKLGYEVQGGFEQFQATHVNAAVLRANTNKGRVYLKVSNSIEGKVTNLIASFAPQLVRKPIFVNEEKQWMLMSDQGEHVKDETRDDDFCRLLIELGKLQVQSLQHIEALKDLGLQVESSQSLIRQTKALLADKVVQERLAIYEEFPNHAEDGLADITLHGTALYELLRELYDSGKCPLTLTHGDITENVLKADDGSLVLFDWGAARIDIALCDTFCFDSPVTDLAMNEYLSLWENYATASDLRKLLEIVPIHCSLVFILQGFEGGDRMVDEDLQMLARLLVDAKEVTDKRNV